MARNFAEVCEKIKKVGPEELVRELDNSIQFWAPEVVWFNLSRYVNRHVEKNSEDATSIAVYAILCDCSETEIKERFVADGF